MSSDSLLEVQGLDCGYPGRLVLENVGFEARPGEIIALLGPNGSGKSTLLKTICGSLKPLKGNVVLNGQELHSLRPRVLAQRVGFVPQEEQTPFDFTALQMAMMGRLAYSEGLFETRKDHEVTRCAMEQTDCWDFADRKYGQLSGGEKQRVLLARALAQEAGVLLLDEPNSHLDVRHLLEFQQLLQGFSNSGKLILVALHDLNLASMFAGRGLILSGGRVVLDGPMPGILQSSELESAYGVAFERILSSTGHWRIFPKPGDQGLTTNGC